LLVQNCCKNFVLEAEEGVTQSHRCWAIFFLLRRGLTVVFLVANEVLEEVKRRKRSCIFFKVDYEKA